MSFMTSKKKLASKCFIPGLFLCNCTFAINSNLEKMALFFFSKSNDLTQYTLVPQQNETTKNGPHNKRFLTNGRNDKPHHVASLLKQKELKQCGFIPKSARYLTV